MNIRKEIEESTLQMRSENLQVASKLTKKALLTDFIGLTYQRDGKKVWTKALQRAVDLNEIVEIPSSDEIYYVDGTVIIPSDRRIIAHGAHIKQLDGTKVILFRNSHTADGTHAPISGKERNRNISISGGKWEECCTERLGYGKSGKYDDDRSFYGVSSFFFFNNMDGLTLSDLTFAHAGGFCLQCGDIKNAVFENILFEECYADGLHINGNTENVYIKNIKGYVGDDLVALNMYDWQDSSVDFGPMKNVFCDSLTLSEDSPYKAMRIEPGIYTYDSGEKTDCSANRLVIRNVKGIQTYKMYFQTPSYTLDSTPERGDVGSGGDIYFENIEIDLAAPIDRFDNYMNSDPVTGSFAGFELGSNLTCITLENIDIKLDKERFPMAFLLCAGPKSAIFADNREAFDPYLGCKIGKVILKNITVNGSRLTSTEDYVHEIVFDDIYPECKGRFVGEIEEIVLI